MTDEDRKKQAAVLASIADCLPWDTIEDWNKRRFTPDELAQEAKRLRARFIIPESLWLQ